MLLESIMSRQGVNLSQAILVEDDINEINSVEGLCRSVFESHRTGMLPYEINTIREMAGLPLTKAPLISPKSDSAHQKT